MCPVRWSRYISHKWQIKLESINVVWTTAHKAVCPVLWRLSQGQLSTTVAGLTAHIHLLEACVSQEADSSHHLSNNSYKWSHKQMTVHISELSILLASGCNQKSAINTFFLHLQCSMYGNMDELLNFRF